MTDKNDRRDLVIKKITELYDAKSESDYIGERVTQREHMIQAAMLAENGGCSRNMILAALFHDIGHLLDYPNMYTDGKSVGVKDHEKIGADYLRELGMNEMVCRLVENHVRTKRYLVTKYPEKYDELSTASKQTLVHQGGLMNARELGEFENDNLYNDHLQLREFDNAAKVIDKSVKDLSYFLRFI